MNTFRVCKTGEVEDIFTNIICSNFQGVLNLAVIRTVKKFKEGQRLNIPDKLYNSIKWTSFFPSDKYPFNESSYTELNVNICRETKAGKILFDQFHRIYYMKGNNCFYGFIYIKNFDILASRKLMLPKLHISTNCPAIESEFNFRFPCTNEDAYEFTFTNTITNDVIYRKDKTVLKNQNLEICKYCKNSFENAYSDYEIFMIIKDNRYPKLKLDVLNLR